MIGGWLMPKKNSYTALKKCWNCGVFARIDIPKGTPLSQMVGEVVKCSECGCAGIYPPMGKHVLEPPMKESPKTSL
jgi:hypothetical protein